MVSVRFLDALRVPASTSLQGRVDDGTTIAALITAANSQVANLHGISDDALISADVTITNEQTLAIVGTPKSVDGLTITMETSALTRDWGIWIPAVKAAMFGSDGKFLLTGTAAISFADELVAGSGPIVWETPYGNAYTALESGGRFQRKLRGLTSKKSSSGVPV